MRFTEKIQNAYLRQFFVQRDKRRSGVGRRCIKILFSEVWPLDKRIMVDVQCQNSAAIAFWRSVGCTDYSLSLEIHPDVQTKLEGIAAGS
jgi:predicted acetyltransferase